VCARACVCACERVHVNVCASAYVCVRMCVCASACVRARVCVSARCCGCVLAWRVRGADYKAGHVRSACAAVRPRACACTLSLPCRCACVRCVCAACALRLRRALRARSSGAYRQARLRRVPLRLQHRLRVRDDRQQRQAHLKAENPNRAGEREATAWASTRPCSDPGGPDHCTGPANHEALTLDPYPEP
jgi:hypothetical protein